MAQIPPVWMCAKISHGFNRNQYVSSQFSEHHNVTGVQKKDEFELSHPPSPRAGGRGSFEFCVFLPLLYFFSFLYLLIFEYRSHTVDKHKSTTYNFWFLYCIYVFYTINLVGAGPTWRFGNNMTLVMPQFLGWSMVWAEITPVTDNCYDHPEDDFVRRCLHTFWIFYFTTWWPSRI